MTASPAFLARLSAALADAGRIRSRAALHPVTGPDSAAQLLAWAEAELGVTPYTAGGTYVCRHRGFRSTSCVNRYNALMNWCALVEERARDAQRQFPAAGGAA